MTSMTARLAASCLVLATACGNDNEPGSATINYTLALPGITCNDPALGIGGLGEVVTVRATLSRGDTMIVREEPCDPNEGISVDSAPSGNYDLLMEGVDAVGTTVMDNAKHPESQSIEIIGGSTQEFEADLFPTPGMVEAQLNILVDGQFAQCQFLEVQAVELTMFRNTTAMHTYEFDVCNTMPGYNSVEDPEGLIEGAELNQILVVAKDGSGGDVAEFTIPIMPPPGAGKTVQISINCDNTDCMGVFDGVVGGGGGGGGTGGTGGNDGGSTGGGSTGGGNASTGAGDGTTGA